MNINQLLMRWLSNPISGSIAGAGGVLFVILISLNIILVGLNDDVPTFLVVFILVIPFYILMLPLISLTATLIDNSHLGDFKEGMKHSLLNSLIGSTLFVLLLLITILLVVSDDGIDILTDGLGVSILEIFMLILVPNLISTTIGSIINGYRTPSLSIASVNLDSYNLAPSTIVEIIRNDGPREYYNSLIARGDSSNDALKITMEKFPDWNPMADN
jgi:hypothetical protein